MPTPMSVFSKDFEAKLHRLERDALARMRRAAAMRREALREAQREAGFKAWNEQTKPRPRCAD